ncbi:MAG: protein-L-isoaspartate(D-aspartate) O-methyltransferase [Gammaproteobacteria bacterium]|nr:protein-L-isoaspartate(D-aspartate) O-methyltransferase [Gammaproteobacteria bacterium]
MTNDESAVSKFLGKGVTSQIARDRLAQRLREQGIRSEKILDVIRFTPRHVFIEEALDSHAYDNYPLPIGYGQTISQPYIVARMTEALLGDEELDKVLEIGTGCGYQTAILAQLAGKVCTVERIKALAVQARKIVNSLGLVNVCFRYGDGYLGWPEHGPYQGIMVTAAPETVPSALLEQLAPGGRMVIPVGPNHSYQILKRITRTRTGYNTERLDDVAFVPLKKGIS